MALRHMHHVGITVTDLTAAINYFAEVGFALEGRGSISGAWVGRIIGVDEPTSEMAMLLSPDGNSRLELVQFTSPVADGPGTYAPVTRVGINHICCNVADLDGTLERLRAHGGELVGTVENYEDVYRLCYVTGPDGIIVELAQDVSAS